MTIAQRTATTIWEGPLAEGTGLLHAASGAFSPLPVTWAARTHEPGGQTSPEEFASAAHSHRTARRRRIRPPDRQRRRTPTRPVRPRRPRAAVHPDARHRETFSRYPQLYSCVGFAHHYRPLTGEELTFVLTRRWHKPGLDLDPDDFTDAQAVATVARITGGNFRLLQRLFAQIHRIMKINELHTITADVVETARSTLVIESAT